MLFHNNSPTTIYKRFLLTIIITGKKSFVIHLIGEKEDQLESKCHFRQMPSQSVPLNQNCVDSNLAFISTDVVFETYGYRGVSWNSVYLKGGYIGDVQTQFLPVSVHKIFVIEIHGYKCVSGNSVCSRKGYI